jgi:RNA polymerase sigma-70 factor (ECF subfamily)
MDPLVRAFFEVVGPDGAARDLGDPALVASRLAALYERGRAAHPALKLSGEAFARGLGRSVESDRARALESLAIEDLFLACACAEGIPGAADAFERGYAAIVARAVARVLPSAPDRDEAAQLTKRSLLVAGAGGPPKLAKYCGHGPLENWVSVAAIRTAVSMERSERAQRRLRDRTTAETAGGISPELLAMKGELRQALEEAMAAALERLDHRDRLVLGFYLVSGMSMDAIGKMYGVTQQTVSRWLLKARKAVLADVRRQLGERLNLGKSELASIARLVASQLDISISRLLGAA